jgi:phosphate/sulfate permease
LNHAIPISATVMAVKAAIGLMACKATKEVAKNINKTIREDKMTIVPIAKLLWLNFFPHCL